MPPIHHVIAGNAYPPVAFVHGFACDHADWDAQVLHLSPRHQTVAVDLRCHGASDMLRTAVPAARIEIVEATEHFPQLNEPWETNALLDCFLASL
jgi:hypothetical protein